MAYLDYAATYPYVKYPSSAYGPFLNPNANYAYKEKRLLSEAEDRVKKAIGTKSGKVVFGGTSSQLIENLMTAVDEQTNFRHVVCSAYEHDSFFRYKEGTINNIGLLDKLLSAYEGLSNNFDQIFVVWQGVSNITGEIFPVKDIGHLCHKYNAFYICDATALLGHTPIESNIDDWCDFYVFSGHKLGTELGIGCCWVSDRLDEWLNGFKLHGTPNLAGALAMTQAVEEACNKWLLYERIWHYADLANCLSDELVRNNIEFNIVPEYSDNDEPPFAYAINAIRLPGFNARVLQSYLTSKEIYIGLGQSSCADKADRRILCQGYGLSEQEADEVVRISFGTDNSVKDVETLVKEIKNFKELYL